jgi:hypothetical protein
LRSADIQLEKIVLALRAFNIKIVQTPKFNLLKIKDSEHFPPDNLYVKIYILRRKPLMPKKKGKSPSFDVMIKFFMQHYGIPTKKDIEKLSERLEHLEELIVKSSEKPSKNTSKKAKIPRIGASDLVLEIIKKSKDGIGFKQIQTKTGFDEKKVRNIVFRLKKTGKIKAKKRGIYVVS